MYFLPLLATASVALAGIDGPISGYKRSCDAGFSLGSDFFAKCGGPGGEQTSFVRLNDCLANDGGWLNYRTNGHAFNSCTDVWSGNGILHAKCPAADGVLCQNTVDLNSFVGNLGGKLAC